MEDRNSDLGIAILVDENELHTQYPVGRRVFINLEGLSISDYNGLPQLGMGIDNSSSTPRMGSIPSTLVEQVLEKGILGVTVTPRERTLTTLNAQDINTLVKIEGLQFQTATPLTTYADNNPTSPQSVNHTLVDCAKNEIILRNSGYASIAGQIVPSGNGAIVGVYSIFRSDIQLFIRDTTDITFEGSRCGVVPVNDKITIQELRSLYSSGTLVAPNAYIEGIVISDASSGNIDARNIVIQEGAYGIVARFASNPNIALGSKVKINVTDIPLSEFRGLLQVSTLPVDFIEVVGTGTVLPTEMAISEINPSIHESTLIKLNNVTLSGSSSYAGSVNISDATGSTILFTRTQAAFSGQALPSGQVSVTCIVSDFDGLQVIIRTTDDVQGGTIDPPVMGIDETFSGQSNDVDIAINGWSNIAVKGTRLWRGKSFQGKLYAQATAFKEKAPEMESWLITSEVNTLSTKNLTFETAKAFYVHDGLTVWVTQNFNGDPSMALWQPVNAKIAGASDADNAWVPSGSIDLSGYGDKVRVGFKYIGAGGSNTTTYRIDNVKIQ